MEKLMSGRSGIIFLLFTADPAKVTFIPPRVETSAKRPLLAEPDPLEAVREVTAGH